MNFKLYHCSNYCHNGQQILLLYHVLIASDGCWSATTKETTQIGTKGYYKCDQVECKPDKTWQPTGQRLPNCRKLTYLTLN